NQVRPGDILVASRRLPRPSTHVERIDLLETLYKAGLTGALYVQGEDVRRVKGSRVLANVGRPELWSEPRVSLSVEKLQELVARPGPAARASGARPESFRPLPARHARVGLVPRLVRSRRHAEQPPGEPQPRHEGRGPDRRAKRGYRGGIRREATPLLRPREQGDQALLPQRGGREALAGLGPWQARSREEGARHRLQHAGGAAVSLPGGLLPGR